SATASVVNTKRSERRKLRQRQPSRPPASTQTRAGKTRGRARPASSGESPPASAAANTSARRQSPTPARTPPAPLPRAKGSVAWVSSVPNHHLVFESDSVRLLHPLPHIGDQRQHIRSRSLPRVHEEICVPLAHPRIAMRKAFQSQLIDHAPGRAARWIFEDA